MGISPNSSNVPATDVLSLIHISTNGEYYTVKKNMDYGLSVYDHIVLDADTVTEGQIIY